MSFLTYRYQKKSAVIAAVAGVLTSLFLLSFQALAQQTAAPATPPKSPSGSSLSRPEGGAIAGEAASPVTADYPIPASTQPTSTGFDYPLGGLYHEGYAMDNCFGCDYLYYWGHLGEDFGNGHEGGAVYSASEGVVVYTGWGPGAWGQVIIVRHLFQGRHLFTQYAHVRDIYVTYGQVVGRRQQIATVGTTGTTEPHLHFEIKDQPVIGHGYDGVGGFAGTTTRQYEGVNFFSPSWWIDNHRYQWDELPDTEPPAGRRYYWSWYDNVGGRNWVLMANPAGLNPGTVDFDVNIRKKHVDLSVFGGAAAAPGNTLTPFFPGLMGGPAIATTLAGEQALVSQRSLWGGSSIEEVPGADSETLSDHLFWPWYDQLSPGFRNWVLLANPSYSDTLIASIYFQNEADGQTIGGLFEIPPGGSVTPMFPGKMGGPVEVKAWVKGGAWENPDGRRPVIGSQRMLINGISFNELPGMSSMSDRYVWTWYDEASPGVRDWILVANPSQTEAVDVQVSFTNLADGQPVQANLRIEPGLSVYHRFPGKMGGPVELLATVEDGDWDNQEHRRPVMASQRILWGPSFGEVPGFAGSALAPEYHWTWYDQATPGMLNWVMISNLNQQPVYYEIDIPGVDNLWAGASGFIAPGQSVFPVFPGKMAGPIKVNAWTDDDRAEEADIFATQRVLYNGHFNELAGTVLVPQA